MHAEDVDADGALPPSAHTNKRAIGESLSTLLALAVTLGLLASLLLMAAPVSALSMPTVSFPATTDDDISRVDADHTIIFVLGKDLEVADTITITFPSGYTIASSITATLSTSPGWVSGSWDDTPNATATFAGNATNRTIVGTVATEAIGEAAQVRIAITDGITNPSTIASYALTVATSDETTAVTSAPYDIKAPTITALPGIVSVYNPVGILMAQFTGATAIADAIASAGEDYTIKVGPGTYSGAIAADVADQTIMSTDGALTTIITGAVTISEKVTFDGFTVDAALQTLTTADSTVKNCVLKGAIGADIDIATTLTDNTYEVGSGEDGIDVANGIAATVSGGTFNVEGEGIVNDGTLALYNVIMIGASGVGIRNTANGSATITDTTFSGLDTALDVDAGTVDIQTSTITGCEAEAINVDTATLVIIMNNTIVDCEDEILQVANVAGLGGKVFMMFNSLIGNVLGIANADRTSTVQAPVNWWGSPTGPRAGHNTGLVNVNSPLGAIAWGELTSEGSLLASRTYGVDVEPQTAAGTAYTPGAGDMIAAGRYQSNPAEISPPDPLADGYYEVYFVDAAPTSNAAQVLIKLYNPDIDADTAAVFWNKAARTWMPASSQGVDTFGGFVWVRVASTTAPSIRNLSGTPFALGTFATPPLGAPAQASLRPAVGATEVDVAPTFSWGSVSGATGYEFTLAEEIGQQDKFAIIEYSANTATNEHGAQGQLKYSITYNWRVRAVDASGSGAWTTGSFTTRAQAPIPPSDDFAIFLEVNGVDIRQQDTIVFDEAGRLLIGIRISDVKRQIVLESIAVEATLAGQIVASVSESLEGVLLAVGDDYENTITLGEDKPMSFGLLGRTTGKFSGQMALTYSSDGSSTAWTVSKPIRIPGNPIGTVAGQIAAGIAALSVIVASWVWGSAASSTIAPGVNVPGEAVADLRSKLSDWVHGKLEEKARERVRLLIMKTMNSRMPKDTCPWCGIPLEHGYCPKCKKSAEQARREYAEHVSELAKKAAGVIEDARRPITLQEIQSALSIIGVARKVSDVLVAMNNAGLIRLRGIGRRKLVRWALGLGIIIGIDAVLWVTVGGWAALPMWALLAIIGGSTVVSWAVTKALEVRGGRRPRAAG